VVHGHSPVARTDIEQSVASLEYLPVINIDNGCFAPASGGDAQFVCAGAGDALTYFSGEYWVR
jgi:hypothetical protein